MLCGLRRGVVHYADPSCPGVGQEALLDAVIPANTAHSSHAGCCAYYYCLQLAAS